MSPRSDLPKDFDVKKLENSDLAGENTVNAKEKKSVESDAFDLFELRCWCQMALVYVVGVYVLYKIGLTMDIVVIALVFCTLFDVTVATWKIQYGERTLYLRKLKESGAEMKKRDNNKYSKDPWSKGENTAGLFFADQVDFAVMKYVGKDVPLLVEQEYRHATMHKSAQKELTEEEEEAKSSRAMNFMRKLFLRRGDRLGIVFCGVIEAANIYGLLLQCLLQNTTLNIMKFHLFEEAEHASVTVNNLKNKNTSIERFLIFPLWVGMCALMPLGFFGELMANPKMLLQSDMYPIILKRLVQSFATPALNLLSVLVHYILPIPTIPSIHRMVWLYLREDCKDMGIEWEVEKKATYPLHWQ